MTISDDRSQSIAHHVAVLMYHDTATGTFDENARTFAELWEDLVPEQGQATSLQGEILRAIGRLAGEDRRDGCVNWDKYYEDLLNAKFRNQLQEMFASRGLKKCCHHDRNPYPFAG
jgi:hypothetical protein